MSEAPAVVGEADLHAHSTVSDGTESPAVLMAPGRGRRDSGASRLTDHDSTSGWAEAAAAVPETGVVLIPGMELSTREGFMSVHMLGYLSTRSTRASLAETARIRRVAHHPRRGDRPAHRPRLRPQLGRRARPDDARARRSAARTSPTPSSPAGTCPTGRPRSPASCTRVRATRSRTTRPTRSRACGSSARPAACPSSRTRARGARSG